MTVAGAVSRFEDIAHLIFVIGLEIVGAVATPGTMPPGDPRSKGVAPIGRKCVVLAVLRQCTDSPAAGKVQILIAGCGIVGIKEPFHDIAAQAVTGRRTIGIRVRTIAYDLVFQSRARCSSRATGEGKALRTESEIIFFLYLVGSSQRDRAAADYECQTTLPTRKVLVKAPFPKVQRQIISAMLDRELLTRRSSRCYIAGLGAVTLSETSVDCR